MMSAEKSDKYDKYLISFLVDHASPRSFFDLIDDGEAPSVSKYILGEKTKDNLYSKASISRNFVTGYPSTSANTHVSIMTGSYAGKNNLLYATFWDLSGKKPVYIDTEEISVSLLSDLNEKFINKHSKLLFEYIPDSASFHAINRGARFKLLTTKALLTKFLPLLLKMKSKDDPGGVNPMAKPDLWRNVFMSNIGDFLKRIKLENSMPKASFIVFLLTDENAHKFGFDSKKYREAVKILDFFVESIVEGVETPKGHIDGLKEMGYLDSVVWNINTDHAGRKVNRDKLIFLRENIEVELGLRIIGGEENKVDKTFKKLKKDVSKVNAFATVGSEIFHCWFADSNKGDLSSFNYFHPEKNYRSIKPIGAFSKHLSKDSVDLIDYLLDKDYTQFVIIPEDIVSKSDLKKIDPKERLSMKLPRDYIVKIFSKEGVGKITRSIIDNDIQYSYSVIEGKDPLDYSKTGLNFEEFYNHREWLAKTITHELPDIFHRLYGFFDCVYAPNFIVTSHKDYHFWKMEAVARKKEKAMANIQTHDGLYTMESIIPATFSGPGIKKGGEISIGRNIDVLPTLLKALDVDFNPEEMDGIVLEEIFEK
jgi:type I phosphodiesterase/nucleotide pyrophosphatase